MWLGCAAALVVAGCAGSGTGLAGWAAERASRRAYDGAPPVVPHGELGIACTACHGPQGMEVPGLGFAPPSPHGSAAEAGALRRCRQCHVPVQTDGLFAATGFTPLRRRLQPVSRPNPFSPPTIPHGTFLRDNCVACHTGPAAPAPIRTSHPERIRCLQCHVPVTTQGEFPGRGRRRPSPSLRRRRLAPRMRCGAGREGEPRWRRPSI